MFFLPILIQWYLTTTTAWKHQWWKHHLLFSDIFREHRNETLAWNGLIRYLIFFATSIKFFTFGTIPISFMTLIYSHTILMEPKNLAMFVVILIYAIFIFPQLTKTPIIFCFFYGIFLFLMKYFDRFLAKLHFENIK